MDSVSLKQNALTVVGQGYRITAKPGYYFEPSSTVTETVVRGVSARPNLTTENLNSVNVGYKFSIPTTLPTEALISLPMLVVDSGEIKMVIVSFRKSKSATLQYFSTDGVYDHFKLAGRPLVKGV
jgi:hypothetical protein